MAKTEIYRPRARGVDAQRIIGCKVENEQGESLGKIESLIIDLVEGRVVCAVLSFGGFLGLGEKLFPIPIEGLKYRPDEGRFLLNVERETLKNAPGYDRENMPDMNDRSYTSKVYSHYGYMPYWGE